MLSKHQHIVLSVILPLRTLPNMFTLLHIGLSAGIAARPFSTLIFTENVPYIYIALISQVWLSTTYKACIHHFPNFSGTLSLCCEYLDTMTFTVSHIHIPGTVYCYIQGYINCPFPNAKTTGECQVCIQYLNSVILTIINAHLSVSMSFWCLVRGQVSTAWSIRSRLAMSNSQEIHTPTL